MEMGVLYGVGGAVWGLEVRWWGFYGAGMIYMGVCGGVF